MLKVKFGKIRIEFGDAGMSNTFALTCEFGNAGFLIGQMGNGKTGVSLSSYDERIDSLNGIEIVLHPKPNVQIMRNWFCD